MHNLMNFTQKRDTNNAQKYLKLLRNLYHNTYMYLITKKTQMTTSWVYNIIVFDESQFLM